MQLQLLTATVKCFLKNPEDSQEMVQRVLDMATEESDNPDLRDRGFVYWRLLSTDPEAAKTVVLCEKPVIEDDTSILDPQLLDTLITQIATLSSIYHKPPETFVTRANIRAAKDGGEEEEDGDVYEDENDVAQVQQQTSSSGGAVDLLDMGGVSLEGASAAAGGGGGGGGGGDLFGFDGGSSSPAAASKVSKTQVATADKTGGLEVFVGFSNSNGTPVLEMEVNNQGTTPVNTLAIQLNKNAFGLAPTNQQLVFSPPVLPGSSGTIQCPLAANPNLLAPPAPGQPASPVIQAAIKNMQTGGVFYFSANLPLESTFTPDGALERSTFINSWKSIPSTNEIYSTVPEIPTATVDAVTSKFSTSNIFFIARRPVPGQDGQEVAYFSCTSLSTHTFLFEVTFKSGVTAVKLCVKSEEKGYAGLAKEAIERCLKA